MAHYLLSMHYPDDGTPPEGELKEIMADVETFNGELREQGAWVFTAGLHPASTATVVRRQDGNVLTTDGPYLETKEQLGGFWVIDAEDLDAALGWAAKAVTALRGLPIEVRPVAERG
jgi:hypothetical protein